MNGKVTNAPPFWQLLDTFRSLFKVHFMHTKCCFKSWEVKSLELQTVCKLELKRRSYGRLKTIVQTMSWNVAAAPHFATVGHIFETLPGSQIMYTISHFEAWEVRSPVLQMVHDLDLKLRSYSHLKTNRTKPMRKFFWFRSCAPISKGVLQLRNHPLAHECHFAAPVRPFHSCKMGCENSHPPRNPPPATKMLQA